MKRGFISMLLVAILFSLFVVVFVADNSDKGASLSATDLADLILDERKGYVMERVDALKAQQPEENEEDEEEPAPALDYTIQPDGTVIWSNGVSASFYTSTEWNGEEWSQELYDQTGDGYVYTEVKMITYRWPDETYRNEAEQWYQYQYVGSSYAYITLENDIYTAVFNISAPGEPDFIDGKYKVYYEWLGDYVEVFWTADSIDGTVGWCEKYVYDYGGGEIYTYFYPANLPTVFVGEWTTTITDGQFDNASSAPAELDLSLFSAPDWPRYVPPFPGEDAPEPTPDEPEPEPVVFSGLVSELDVTARYSLSLIGAADIHWRYENDSLTLTILGGVVSEYAKTY